MSASNGGATMASMVVCWVENVANRYIYIYIAGLVAVTKCGTGSEGWSEEAGCRLERDKSLPAQRAEQRAESKDAAYSNGITTHLRFILHL